MYNCEFEKNGIAIVKDKNTVCAIVICNLIQTTVIFYADMNTELCEACQWCEKELEKYFVK